MSYIVNEIVLVKEVEEYFNNEIITTGLSPLGDITKDVAIDFTNTFFDIERVTFTKDELNFAIQGEHYKVERTKDDDDNDIFECIVL